MGGLAGQPGGLAGIKFGHQHTARILATGRRAQSTSKGTTTVRAQ
jgi:hypothetical protein